MQANENTAEMSTRAAKSLEYTPGVVSFYDSVNSKYTGGIMPDQCAACGSCQEFWQQLCNECPVLLIDSNYADQSPMAGDNIISNPERCTTCSACVDYWSNNIAGVCPGLIELRIAPKSSESQDWFTLSKKSGSGNDTISVEAQPNAQRYCREGTIIVKSGNGNISKQVKILQYGAATYKLILNFVGVQEGNLFKIYSYWYNFMNDAAEDEDSDYKIRVKLLNDGLPLQFPDSSSELVLLATIKKGSTASGNLSKTFTTPITINSKTALSFNTITATSVAGKGDVYVSKDTSRCNYIEERFLVDTSPLSASADGGIFNVSVTTQLPVTWTVE